MIMSEFNVLICPHASINLTIQVIEIKTNLFVPLNKTKVKTPLFKKKTKTS